jgi:hypothetical protein
MVSPKLINLIRDLYDALAELSLDVHEYSGPLFDVVFDVVTADSFVAGIARKLLDGNTITPEERAFIARPRLMNGGWWRCDDGQLFDIRPYARVKVVADAVERLRCKCDKALSSSSL